MFTGFPIEQIEKQIEFLTSFAVQLPSTDEDITYDYRMNGDWIVSSEKWNDLRGRKYSLMYGKEEVWRVYLHGMFLCELIDFDKHLSKLANKKKGIPEVGSLFMIFGILMMISGLFYDDSVSSDSSTYSYRRVVNSGKVSERATITNVGGFLSVCGSIFICAASLKQRD